MEKNMSSVIAAMQELQKQMEGEAERTGLTSEEAVVELVKEIRRGEQSGEKEGWIENEGVCRFFAQKEADEIEAALDEAELAARQDNTRYTGKEVFGRIRERMK